jgi:hypothetical protein
MIRFIGFTTLAVRRPALLFLLSLALSGMGSGSASAEESVRIRCPGIAQEPGSAQAPPGLPSEMADGARDDSASAGSAGMRAYVDPETGEFAVPPGDAPAAAALAPDAATGTAHEGLTETPSPVPGGGVMVRPEGRFRVPLVATRDADGKVTLRHAPCPPSAAGKE